MNSGDGTREQTLWGNIQLLQQQDDHLLKQSLAVTGTWGNCQGSAVNSSCNAMFLVVVYNITAPDNW